MRRHPTALPHTRLQLAPASEGSMVERTGEGLRPVQRLGRRPSGADPAFDRALPNFSIGIAAAVQDHGGKQRCRGAAMSAIDDRIRTGPLLILDGGMGTELQHRGVPMHRVAWSAAALESHPHIVREVHEDYLRAGAEVITANSFGTSRHVLEPAGMGEKVAELNRRAIALAREARDRAAPGRAVWIAGSISSFIAEADLKNQPSPAAARQSYTEQAELLAEAGAEVLLLEMMRDVEYSRLAAECALATGLPVWIGFTCRRTEDGEIVLRGRDVEVPLADAIGPVSEPGAGLLAVMHSELDAVGPALDILASRWSGALGAYPHSGDFVMPNWLFDDIVEPRAFAEAAAAWAGRVRLLGGCCGTGPDHIRELAARLGRTAA
jgi:S-methylmethionine-dependent homocysteine/selenocysteine methylase